MDTTEGQVSGAREPRRGTALSVVILSSFMVPFMMSALNVALPAIGREFAFGAVALGWVVTSYSLATAVVLLPFGRLGDLHGRKRVFVWGLAVFTAGTLLSAVATNGTALLAGRVVNGIGAGMNFATGMAILMTIVPPKERGRAIGWNVAAVYVGLSVGPALGGVIVHDFGWRWIFGLSGLAAFLATALSAWQLDEAPPEAAGARFDLPGSCLYGIALVALIVGCSLVPGLYGFLLLAAGGITILTAGGLYLVPGMTLDAYAAACGTIILAVLAVCVCQGFRYLAKLECAPERPR